jgi:PAS domain S-box-containing protein
MLDEFSSALPTSFLLAAVLRALLVAWLVRSVQLAAEQSATLKRTVADLDDENAARCEAELLRDAHAKTLQVQAAELELHVNQLQTTALALAHQRDELGRAQEFSAALVRSTVDAVAAFDREGRVHAWNPAMASLTGRGQADVGDAVVGTLLPFLANGEEVRLLKEALAGRATTMHALRASNELWHDEVRLDITVTPIRSAVGSVVGGLLVARDVTEQQRIAEIVLASKEAAEQANRAKSDFLARMSHELRTPLNAVIGFTNVIRRNAENRLGRADLVYLDRIGANGRHLLSLINTVLDLSKVESGHETVELQATPISTLVRDTIAELDVRATEAHVQLHLVTPWGAEAVTDRAKLKQVLINLVGNAIKFTPPDGHVYVRVETDQMTGVVTRIDVEDTGIGIAPDRIHAIFEAFEQADTQTALKYGGTGLGLAISQKLCALMGHELIVESEPGKGSTFSILLPLSSAVVAA